MTEESTGKVVGQFGSQKSPLVVKLDKFMGRKTLDIRRYFTNKGDNELLPTKKGLTLTSGGFKYLEEIFNRYGNEINDWLEGSISDSHELVKRTQALENSNNSGREFVIEFDEWSGNTFFALRSEGAVDVIVFNNSHPYVLSIKEQESPEKILEIIAVVIISFKRASYRFDDIDFNYPALFDSLEYEWGNLLKNYN